jgi:hypothetical protein
MVAMAGHVNFVSKEKFAEEANSMTGPGPGGKNYLWWSPFSGNGH